MATNAINPAATTLLTGTEWDPGLLRSNPIERGRREADTRRERRNLLERAQCPLAPVETEEVAERDLSDPGGGDEPRHLQGGNTGGVEIEPEEDGSEESDRPQGAVARDPQPLARASALSQHDGEHRPGPPSTHRV